MGDSKGPSAWRKREGGETRITTAFDEYFEMKSSPRLRLRSAEQENRSVIKNKTRRLFRARRPQRLQRCYSLSRCCSGGSDGFILEPGEISRALNAAALGSTVRSRGATPKLILPTSSRRLKQRDFCGFHLVGIDRLVFLNSG